MKLLKKIFAAELIIAWVIYVLLVWLFQSLMGNVDFSFTWILNGFICALMISGASVCTMYFLLKPKLKFLTSDSKNIPPFGNKVEKTFAVERPDFHFEVVKYKIKEKYEITVYDDAKQYIIKFHSKISLFSRSSICGMITYDAVTKAVTLTCFPIVGYTEKAAKETHAAIDKIKSLIVNK